MGRSHLALVRLSSAFGAAAVSAGTTREALWGRAQLSEACGTTFNNLRAANGSHLFASLSPIQQHGSWTPETPVSAEKRQEAGRDQEIQRPRPEDRGESGAGVHVWRLQGQCRKCQIPRPSSSILRASTLRALFPQSWRAWRRERPRTPEVDCIKHHNKSPDLKFYSAGHDQRSYLSFIHASSPSLQT